MIKIGCLGICGVLLGLLLKQMKSPFGDVIGLATCLLIVFFSLNKLSSVFELINMLDQYVSGQKEYLRILLKIIGIT